MISQNMKSSISKVQAIYFRISDGWTPDKARRWIQKHELQPIKRLHRIGDELRYRIEDPYKFKNFTTKILNSDKGRIYLVLGWK